MPEQTAVPATGLVDISGLSLHDLDDLDDGVIARALREVLDPSPGETEVTSSFESS
ncbi:FxSxx-COOH cyclophane-containing RiPP peptide [Actinomadura kijaniata]|uniref:FxSxx-COOH cyclophane-containing RiPP peptide n=1 Tax=Actinomadura kijaniata TaxID=46161 RepID=UPI00083798BF|nr:FxSxx-COOH cyclophane-containing RiPP peptide [Actinomadura kijaniata]